MAQVVTAYGDDVRRYLPPHKTPRHCLVHDCVRCWWDEILARAS